MLLVSLLHIYPEVPRVSHISLCEMRFFWAPCMKDCSVVHIPVNVRHSNVGKPFGMLAPPHTRSYSKLSASAVLSLVFIKLAFASGRWSISYSARLCLSVNTSSCRPIDNGLICLAGSVKQIKSSAHRFQ